MRRSCFRERTHPLAFPLALCCGQSFGKREKWSLLSLWVFVWRCCLRLCRFLLLLLLIVYALPAGWWLLKRRSECLILSGRRGDQPYGDASLG